jgi:transcriptional regulator with XRE-family HTH domain
MRRMMLDMSQTDLAHGIGLSFQQVQKYEKGSNRMGASRLQQMADTRAGTLKCTSQILVGLMARGGFVESREGVGCWVSGYKSLLNRADSSIGP